MFISYQSCPHASCRTIGPQFTFIDNSVVRPSHIWDVLPFCYACLMDRDQLRGLFEQVRTGAMDVDSALTRMQHMPFEDLGFAKVDHHRELRHGMPEVIF